VVEEGEGPSAGGGEDFGDLYRANLRPLLGMATALIGSRAQAEEVVQEAFATTFDHYGRLEDPTKALRRSVLRGCASRKPDPDDPTRVTERILGRVRALGRGPRDAVALCYSLGLDAPEIDRTLGLEEGTAAMRLHEAGTELRSGLEVGDDLDQTLETAFAETTAGLGHLLARPGDAQRRVYRRRRIRVAIAAVAVVIALIVLVVVLRPSSSENLSTGGTDASVTSPSSATTTVPGDTTTTTAAPTTTEAPTTTAAAAAATYTVVSGDGWYAVAKKVDVPVDSLLQANGATLSTPLHVGEVLKVPPKAPPTT
jgi:DNA-directed RNA polymerase specialized sigma24 family protein/LysM repeat protein